MKTFTVELWAQLDLGHMEDVTLPEDIEVDPNNPNTICVLSRMLVKYTKQAENGYQKRPISNGDVVRVGNRRFCIFVPNYQNDQKYYVLELSKVP